MRTKKVLLTVGALLIVLPTVVVLYAQQRSAKPKLSAEDWIEIRQLYSKYAIFLDTKKDNGESFASLFTEDGVYDTNAVHRGHKEIAEQAAEWTRRWEVDQLPNHYSSINVLIEPSSEGAVGTAYFVMMESHGQSGPSVTTFNGVYNDVFVKTRDGWKFKSRKFRRANAAVARTTTSGTAR